MHGYILIIVLVAIFCGSAVFCGQSGAPTEADVNDETVQEMAKFGVSQMGDEYILVSVNKVQKKLVAGNLYIMEVNVQKTSSLGTTQHLTCDIQVIDVPWFQMSTLSEFSCNSSD